MIDRDLEKYVEGIFGDTYVYIGGKSINWFPSALFGTHFYLSLSLSKISKSKIFFVETKRIFICGGGHFFLFVCLFVLVVVGCYCNLH